LHYQVKSLEPPDLKVRAATEARHASWISSTPSRVAAPEEWRSSFCDKEVLELPCRLPKRGFNGEKRRIKRISAVKEKTEKPEKNCVKRLP